MPLPDDVQVMSVDDHVIEHRRVWVDRVPSKFGDAIPHIERLDDGNDWWFYEGHKAGNFALNAVAGKPWDQFNTDPRTYDDMRPGCFDIAERTKDMDADGVWAQMCFPNMAGFAGRIFESSADKDLGHACVVAYNDFILDEWCGYAPGRQVPVMLLPYWDVEASVREVYRVAAKGAKTYTFPELPHMRGFPSYHTSHWDPLFAATQETDLVVSIHFGSSGKSDMVPQGGMKVIHFGNAIDPAKLADHQGNAINDIAIMGLNSAFAMAQLLTSPVFHKFPRLRFALSEGGIGWLPYMLERIDYVWERHRSYNPQVNQEIPPSVVFKDHIFGCFISDAAGIANRHLIGVDNIMFESDYPHADSNWPHSRKMLAEALADVPDDEARKIAEDNARRVFNFPRLA